MLQINLQRVCKVRGIDKPMQYMQSRGISLSTATRALKGEYENFSMLTIERLCLIFHCTPNDLLEWKPSQNSTLPESEPLFTLRREEKVAGMSQLINSVSLDKLEQMEAIIRKELGV